MSTILYNILSDVSQVSSSLTAQEKPLAPRVSFISSNGTFTDPAVIHSFLLADLLEGCRDGQIVVTDYVCSVQKYGTTKPIRSLIFFDWNKLLLFHRISSALRMLQSWPVHSQTRRGSTRWFNSCKLQKDSSKGPKCFISYMNYFYALLRWPKCLWNRWVLPNHTEQAQFRPVLLLNSLFKPNMHDHSLWFDF